MDSKINRTELLNMASTRVNVKSDTRGTPESSFTQIAEMWSSYLGLPLDPSDVCMMMILLKVARASMADELDTFIDIAGYAACAAEVMRTNEEEA